MGEPQTRVVILGAGFGGLELASRLSAALGERVDVTLVDRSDSFVFGFSKLDVMFGKADPAHVELPYSDRVHPGVTFVRGEVLAVNPESRSVTLDSGNLQADILVVALGADVDPGATPGLVEAGREFYSREGAWSAREALAEFEGGRVLIAVTSTPFKCPPAPSETALLTHDFLASRGLRDRSEIALVMPLPLPVPPSPEASEALLGAFASRGIAWHPERLVREVDPQRRVAVLADGTDLAFDLLLAVPHHRAPAVVIDAGMTEDGWIPVDPRTLRTRYPDVYAVGDVTSVGTPKAGVFAEGQAAVVAQQIIERAQGTAVEAQYDGRGICYLEFGGHEVAAVDVTFPAGSPPHGTLEGPSLDLAAVKEAFGAERASRWFGREWTPVGGPTVY